MTDSTTTEAPAEAMPELRFSDDAEALERILEGVPKGTNIAEGERVVKGLLDNERLFVTITYANDEAFKEAQKGVVKYAEDADVKGRLLVQKRRNTLDLIVVDCEHPNETGKAKLLKVLRSERMAAARASKEAANA